MHTDLLLAGGRQKMARGPPQACRRVQEFGGRAVPPTACPEKQVQKAQGAWAGAPVHT